MITAVIIILTIITICASIAWLICNDDDGPPDWNNHI